MRHGHSTINPGVIHMHARGLLERCLDWRPRRCVTVAQVLRLLLLMAAHRASLFAIARRFFASCFSHQTANAAVMAQLPSRERLTDGLVGALHDSLAFSRGDRRRRWLVAIDSHFVGYYGRHTPDLVGGPKRQGTKWFFGYATAVLLHERRRYTVGLMALSAGQRPDQIVKALLDQIARKGLKIKGVTLDAGFNSGDTLLLLQERGLAYSVPLSRCGKGANARNRLFEGRDRTVRWAEWKTERTHRPVRTRTLLVKRTAKTMVFAFAGWSGERACNVHRLAERRRQLYRQRFGIETSYRQKNQAQAMTTSRDPVYRLLLEGVAYLLRQVWVVLTEQIARETKAQSTAWVAALSFSMLLDWLAAELEAASPEVRSIPLGQTS